MNAGKKILFVDDEPSLRQSVKLVLEVDGFEVSVASSGPEALAAFQPGVYDVVITDMRMPGMPGSELVRQIKQVAPHQPVLMLTAFTHTPCGPENPADALIHKPIIDMQGFRKTVRNLARQPSTGIPCPAPRRAEPGTTEFYARARRQRLQQLTNRLALVETEILDFTNGVREGVGLSEPAAGAASDGVDWIGPQPEIILWLVRGFVREMDQAIGLQPGPDRKTIDRPAGGRPSSERIEITRPEADCISQAGHDWHHAVTGDPLTIFICYRGMLLAKVCDTVPRTVFLESAKRMDEATGTFVRIFRRWVDQKFSPGFATAE